MWFKDQSNRYWNSDKFEVMQVEFDKIGNGKEIWGACGEFNGYKYILYQGSEQDCRVWVENLVRTINKYKVGVL